MSEGIKSQDIGVKFQIRMIEVRVTPFFSFSHNFPALPLIFRFATKIVFRNSFVGHVRSPSERTFLKLQFIIIHIPFVFEKRGHFNFYTNGKDIIYNKFKVKYNGSSLNVVSSHLGKFPFSTLS